VQRKVILFLLSYPSSSAPMSTLALAETRLRQFLALTKPRVVSLIVFCAVIGMFLAVPGLPPAGTVFFATLGIALVAGAAAAVNCLVEQKIDAVMVRTRARPLPRGEVTSLQTLVFAGLVGGLGLWLLHRYVNPLTMWLTLATFVGYAVIYTVLLKPATPQNIVIGGASGAMPPVLGWTAIANDVSPEPLLLFLIIFMWTPPHFWALALYRTQDYARAGLPMLPVTHGSAYTRLQIVLYTLALLAASLLPYAIRMSGLLYLVAALVLSGTFLVYAIRLYRRYSDDLARATFRYSIVYLAALFSALLIDHYWQ
jgi:heme o synthase